MNKKNNKKQPVYENYTEYLNTFKNPKERADHAFYLSYAMLRAEKLREKNNE